jgi:CelD/BcsL family acetyltransferase involved in cellulose biosynthesis
MGVPGVLADRRVQEFHSRAAPALLESRVLRLYGLRFEGKLVACLYALVEDDVMCCYLQAFDPHYAPFSPGVNILGTLVEDAVRMGMRRADFLRGGESYKYQWGATVQPTYASR